MTPAVSPSGMMPPEIVYPGRDGKPMADNTKQARWIVLLYANLRVLFAERADVFVACDLLWYPRYGDDRERMAPDVMVAFGRPKGDRGPYKQWEEGDIPVTVAFEILSPGNTPQEMADKYLFYEHHGVEEYYVYDPDANTLEIYRRGRSALVRERDIAGYVSRRLGIRFEMTRPEMTVFRPGGRRFVELEEAEAERLRQEQRADEEKRRAEEATRRADGEKLRADEEKLRADEEGRQRRRQTELSRKARKGQASAEELAELDRLEAESP